VAISDFGGGLSSFSHLHSIGPNYIKLSNSLTRELGGSRGSTALLRAVQEITADQGIYSIAEGIHEVAAIEHLKNLGISYAEGKAAGPCEPFEVWLEGAVLR
jgi:EAL domain-containing protein (putative c-di-GMP-specific phosphodiesterase class I)